MDVADAEGEMTPDLCVDSEPGSEEPERGFEEPVPYPHQPDQSSEKVNIRRRLKTFLDWTGRVLPLQLSIAGFIFKGPGDTTECESCRLTVDNWRGTDKPLDVHRRRSPNCSFLAQWFPLKEDNVIILDNLFNATYAKHRAFAPYVKRLATFDVWPLKGELQAPSKMAEAGFMYIGSADRARCFNCELTLRDWDTEDDPFDAHLTWSPKCQYIQKLHEERKKRTGIPLSSMNVKSNTSTTSTPAPMSSTSSWSTTNPPTITSSSSGSSGRWKHSIQVETVLAMGFSEELINAAIERRRETEEEDFPDATSLFCAVEALASEK